YVGGIFHLLSHALFKAALFLAAGVILHATGSIYIHEKALSRKHLPFTWLFMWLAALSLAGVPPFSGFWSKDEVLLASIASGQIGLFLVGLLTAGMTAFYSVRMMGYVFHRKSVETSSEEPVHGESPLMWIPFGILASLTLVLGLGGYWLNQSLHSLFEKYFTESLKLTSISAAHPSTGLLNVAVPLASLAIIIVGGVPAYSFYISRKADAWKIVSGNAFLRAVHKIFWNRWYIDQLYNLIFVKSVLTARPGIQGYIENSIDRVLNVGVPELFTLAYRGLRKVQTGILSVNMLYILFFLLIMVFAIVMVVI
ncbi:MAG: hypothetical protein J7J94_01880, partial [Thaumarchaeota archaeon]|nr:hypothetical protein [Nitrososphaerota archaeon]